ncbi:MAG TPA: DNA gyrase inhibitor YacG [Beijerinckia sp.]|jgi:endogenous inhibitor of DNA gyrase (YacG/DUF329 family)|nr:DNA gyrase inhibitor YacG [Beijerinckia sp.]
MASPEQNDKRDEEGAPRARSCPICGKPTVEAVRPFCSKRCADIDLHRWLGGVYVISGDPAEDDDASPSDSIDE